MFFASLFDNFFFFSQEIDNLIKKADKGLNVNEEEIPPPVATKTSAPINPQTQTLPGPPAHTTPTPEVPVEKFTAPIQPAPPPQSSTPKPAPPQPTPSPKAPEVSSTSNVDHEKLNLLVERQKQFKLLALKLKQEGDMDGARKNLGISKVVFLATYYIFNMTGNLMFCVFPWNRNVV